MQKQEADHGKGSSRVLQLIQPSVVRKIIMLVGTLIHPCLNSQLNQCFGKPRRAEMAKLKLTLVDPHCTDSGVPYLMPVLLIPVGLLKEAVINKKEKVVDPTMLAPLL